MLLAYLLFKFNLSKYTKKKMTNSERQQILEEIRRLEAMIANDPNGKASDGWRQTVRNLRARLDF